MTNLQIIRNYCDAQYGKWPEYIWGTTEYGGPMLLNVNDMEWIYDDADVKDGDLVHHKATFGEICTADDDDYFSRYSNPATASGVQFLTPDDSADLLNILTESGSTDKDMYGTPIAKVALDVWTDSAGYIEFVRAVDWE